MDLATGPSKWSLHFQIGPVLHFSYAAGGRCTYCPYPKHDEIITEARDGIEDQVQSIVKEGMEKAFERIIPEVRFVAEIRVAEAWG